MPIPWAIENFARLNSTQDECKLRAAGNADEGLVIQAAMQDAGRGRHGRVWQMVEGNLALSFLLRPSIMAKDIGQISILVGVALAQAIGPKAVLKWPNDVMIEGRKCAGILIESDLKGDRVNWLCIGVGANTQSAPDGAGVIDIARDDFRDRFLAAFDTLYAAYLSDGFASIRAAWLAQSYEKGTALNIGVFEDLDGQGNLVVRDTQNALQTYSSGDVYLASSSMEDHYAIGH